MKFDFEWLKHMAATIGSLFGHDIIKAGIGKVVEKTVESADIHREDFMETRYRLSGGKIPAEVHDIYELAETHLNERQPNAADNLRELLSDPDHGLKQHEQDYFQMTVTQLPHDRHDEDQKERAIEDTYKILRKYGEMDVDQWKRAIIIRNFRRPDKNANIKRASRGFKRALLASVRDAERRGGLRP